MNTLGYKIRLIHQVWYEHKDVSNYDRDLNIVFSYHHEEKDLNVIVSTDDDYIYVCFRGTENLINTFDNLIPFPRIKVGLKKYKCHRRWAKSFFELNEKLEPVIHNLFNEKRRSLVLIGHSMGSALAGIAALHYMFSLPVYELFLLANPGFTEKRAVKDLEERITKIESYMNGKDYIQTLVPFLKRPKFKRIGRNYFPPFSFIDHLPYDYKGRIGYVNALKTYCNESFKNPWE